MDAAVAIESTARRAKLGEQSAIGVMFDTHWAGAWQVAYAVTHDRTLADDAAQEGMIKAFRSLDRYDTDRPFAPWLHAIVVNCARDIIRRDMRYAARHAAMARPDCDEAPGLDKLWDALAEMSVDRRTVLLLRYWFDYEPVEIAQIVNIPAGTVHSRIHRALAELRTRLEYADATDR